MTLPLTPDMLRGAYDFLRTTPPFRRWKLPPAEEVAMEVVLAKKYQGAFLSYKGAIGGLYDATPIIQISANHVGHTSRLMVVMAHEMVHFRLKRSVSGNWRGHGARFKKLAKQVCRYHGFDPKEF